MAIDPQKIIEKLKKKENTRGRVTLYLDKDLMDQFRKLCVPVAPSKVIEEFVRQFVESSHPKKK